MASYRNYAIATVTKIWPRRVEMRSPTLEKPPYYFSQGEIAIEDSVNLDKLEELNIKENDKVRLGIMCIDYGDDTPIYWLDVVSKVKDK